MRSRVRLLLLMLPAGLFLPFACASTMVSGFVTRAGTPEAYFVNETEVRCVAGKTHLRLLTEGKAAQQTVECRQWVVGEQLTIDGARNKKSRVLTAVSVEVDRPIPLAVDGYAIVDLIPDPLGVGTGTLRADGYMLHVSPKTKVSFAEGSSLTLGTLKTNVWVRYVGTLRVDGAVDATTLLFSENTVSHDEGKLRKKTEFDAAAVKEEQRQGAVSKYFLGRNEKKIPAYQDEAMQQRIRQIGEKLVPAFQRDLPDADPTKVHFRFQLVDEPKLWNGLSLSSGIVLVPYQTVAALPSDAQLAAVIAVDIAEVMEEQAVRAIPGDRARTGAKIAGSVAGLFVPGVGMGTSLVTGMSQTAADHHRQEQSTRDALAWMHEAGYDIKEAPLAWWTLAAKKNKPLDEVEMPYRTQYAYRLLGTAWR